MSGNHCCFSLERGLGTLVFLFLIIIKESLSIPPPMSSFHIKAMESLVWGWLLMGEGAGGKAFTDPSQQMTMPAVAIYQQLHQEKENTFHSPKTNEAVERTGKTGPALHFPSAHILSLLFSPPFFFSQV